MGASFAVPVRRLPLPGGDVGVFWTLYQMRRAARESATHPIVTAAAGDATDGASDPVAIWRGIRAWLTRFTRFRWDADDPVARAAPGTIEVVHTPLDQLIAIARHGVAYGDCDDVATLGAALALAAGRRARFVVLGFRAPSASAPFRHVYTEINVGPDAWADFDITRRPTTEAPTRRNTVEV